MRVFLFGMVVLLCFAGMVQAGSNDEGGRFGLTFDLEVRYSQLIDRVGTVDIDPTYSILTPGVGYISTKKDYEGESEFRIGIRPEIVLTPHNQGDDDGNSVSMDRLILEFLAEYKKDRFTAGIAYKNYGLEIEDVAGFSEDLANLQTIALYAKFSGFVVGYNFVNVDEEDLGFLTDIEEGTSFILGYAFSF